MRERHVALPRVCLQGSILMRMLPLAVVLIAIWVTVAPVPIRLLVPLFCFSQGSIVSVALLEISAIGMIFAVIPVVVVFVITVVDPILVLIIAAVFFLSSLILLSDRSAYRCRCYKGCGKHKETEQMSMITVHIRLPPGSEIRQGLLGAISMQ
jgi:hypothetical protein